MTRQETAQRAYEALTAAGIYPDVAQRALAALSGAGIQLADQAADELVTRWVDVQLRPVPVDADTIIRTIITTFDQRSVSSTHWLDGLRGPNTVVKQR
jgi:hypothetical protein